MKIIPTSYFGSMGYFREVARSLEVVIESKEHFPKQTYRNRCDILGANGILSLSIPVIKSLGSKTPIDQIEIVDDDWRIRHWRSIESAYKSAPYFDYYGVEVEELLLNDESNLLLFNQKIIQRILKWLDIESYISFSNEFTPINSDDPILKFTGKNANVNYSKAPYIQVFPSNESYHETISILDAVFCQGPMTRKIMGL